LKAGLDDCAGPAAAGWAALSDAASSAAVTRAVATAQMRLAQVPVMRRTYMMTPALPRAVGLTMSPAAGRSPAAHLFDVPWRSPVYLPACIISRGIS